MPGLESYILASSGCVIKSLDQRHKTPNFLAFISVFLSLFSGGRGVSCLLPVSPRFSDLHALSLYIDTYTHLPIYLFIYPCVRFFESAKEAVKDREMKSQTYPRTPWLDLAEGRCCREEAEQCVKNRVEHETEECSVSVDFGNSHKMPLTLQ
jgi:hypothetical protein